MESELIHVLLVEDSPSDAFLAREELAQAVVGASFEVGHVHTLGDALSRVVERRFDVVLLDLNLPDSEGFETFVRLQSTAADVPIVVLSGQSDEVLAVRAVKAGAQDYVVKGQGGLLPRVIRYAIERTRAQLERRRLEEQVIHAHKMEMVGRLSAGVAHDFNNILSVIMGYNDLILSNLDPSDPMHHQAGEIHHAAQRAAGLTRQLLVFSRQETLQPVILDLNDVVCSMGKMLHRLAGEAVEFHVDLTADLGRIHADSGYIGQVLMNLVVNARDAMPNGGHLVIRTEHVKIDRTTAVVAPGLAAGDYVTLSVSDTGCGMTEAVRARMFEAFFTTKKKEEGTGLGLAICQNIVEQSGGHIVVESELARGTTFRIYFPRVEDTVELELPPVVSRSTGNGTVPESEAFDCAAFVGSNGEEVA